MRGAEMQPARHRHLWRCHQKSSDLKKERAPWLPTGLDRMERRGFYQAQEKD
jgi:hypothetical protein